MATRIIYQGNEKAATLGLNNNSQISYMVQTWLEDPKNPNSSAKLPIIVIPPLMKLEAKHEAVLRFIYSGKGLPNDKETLYWVNVQEIPPAIKDQNSLQIAVKTKLKLFYRPQGITMKLHEAAESLHWTIDNGVLKVFNPSPLYVTIGSLQLDGKGKKLNRLNEDMVGPNETITVLSKLPNNFTQVSFTYINEYGSDTPINLKNIDK